MKCPSCGVESGAAYCSNCGERMPVTEPKAKKPFYKKWWVWLIAAVLIIAALGSPNKDSNSDASTGNVKAVEATDQTAATTKQATAPTQKPTIAPTQRPTEAPTPVDNSTLGERNALDKALAYLDYTAFSYKGLIEQLEYEGFSHEEAVYGVDNCGADWKEQAAVKAQQYLDYSSFSRSSLIEQLEFEGFTTEQAEYGVAQVGF